jgi:hypothetical protein
MNVNELAKIIGDTTGWTQHVNGGGWYGPGTSVADSVYIGPDALVYGDALVSKSRDIMVIGPIGSRDDYITYTPQDGCVATGYFRGTLDSFASAVAQTHKQTQTHKQNSHALEYAAMITFLRCVAIQKG